MCQTIQPLEHRTLLSSSLVGGLLTVTGGGADNAIEVENFELIDPEVLVRIDGVEERFARADVTTILVNAGDGNDTVTIGSMKKNIVVNGEAGDDVLLAGRESGTYDGGAGNDLLVGGRASETLTGGDGEDTLRGNGDRDVLRGGDGRDRLDGGSGSDDLLGGNNRDTLQGRAGFDRLYGEGGPDSMDGGSGDDRMVGGNMSDTLDGGAGNDSLNGDSKASGDLAGDILTGGGGNDEVSYPFFAGSAVSITTADGLANDGRAGENDSISDDFEFFSLTQFDDLLDLTGDPGRHKVNGAGGNDTLIGGPGADFLLGYEGNDSLDGGGGEDRLFGGFGDDMLIGDDGFADVIRGGNDNDTAVVDSLLDTVLDVENVS